MMRHRYMYVKRSDYCCMDDDDDADATMTATIILMIETETQSSVYGHGVFTW